MAIDVNGDLKIDLQEAFYSMDMDQKNGTAPEWFTDLDVNNDTVIETKEFDTDLTDKVLVEMKKKYDIGKDRDYEMLFESNEFNSDLNEQMANQLQAEANREEKDDDIDNMDREHGLEENEEEEEEEEEEEDELQGGEHKDDKAPETDEHKAGEEN